jgi:hypothetical protein
MAYLPCIVTVVEGFGLVFAFADLLRGCFGSMPSVLQVANDSSVQTACVKLSVYLGSN